jgi:hypothetical protein
MDLPRLTGKARIFYVGANPVAEIKKTGRYVVTHLPQAQFEPGSRGKVLKNLLGIKRKREMDEVKAREQLRALRELITIYDEDHVFTAYDVQKDSPDLVKPGLFLGGRIPTSEYQQGRFSFCRRA